MVAKAEAVGLKVYTFDQVCAAGRDSPASARPPVPKDLATICYTSGSTGDPKGVMLNHGNIVSLAASSQHYGIVLDINDVHLSYLPMAHMFERFIVANGLSSGFSMGFYMGDAKKIVDDLRALRPTIFPSVPRLFTRIHDSIIGKVTAAGGLKATMFGMALDAKLRGLDDNILHHSLWDAIIFNKLKASIGLDRCRFMITGSAPIGNHVLRFLRAAFGIPVAQGYGLTETSAGTCITDLKDHSTDAHTGPPCVCSEVKLIDVVDMGYHVTDTLHGEEKKEGTDEVIKAGMACCGRGEVCIRGVNVFSGYYKHPELTSGALDADGWLHTGDIGLWHPDGVLQIIDRRKNVFKLAQGEYIAPEKIENVVLKSRMVAQAFVYGDSFKTFVVAVIVPDEPTVMEWAKLHGVSGTFEELCKNDGLRKALLEDMQKMATEAKLSGFERVRRIIIECEPWTVENDMLTPTFKSIRAKFMPRYKTHLDALYE
jgi:long-chain acyl-CoA synthetase